MNLRKIIENNKISIAPSILSADFSELKSILKRLKEADIKIVHFDVMDNHFVDNLTFGHKFIKSYRQHSDLFFDTHLMIDRPEKWIDNYIEAGCNNITFHIEASQTPLELINTIKKADISCGLSIKPKTKITSIEKYLHLADLVLVMTVEPGFGGQDLIESTIDKIKELKKLKENNKNYNYIIEADGGINLNNINHLKSLGMEIAVMGSAFFKNTDYKAFIDKIYNTIDNNTI